MECEADSRRGGAGVVSFAQSLPLMKRRKKTCKPKKIVKHKQKELNSWRKGSV